MDHIREANRRLFSSKSTLFIFRGRRCEDGCSVTGITLFLSAISKNQIVALVAAMAIFLFPILLPITEVNPLFRLVGLLPIYHVLAISLLSVEQMSNGMLYAIWAIPAALLFRIPVVPAAARVRFWRWQAPSLAVRMYGAPRDRTPLTVPVSCTGA